MAPINFLLYVGLLAATSWPAFVANVAAASIVVPVGYSINRHWVWRVDVPGSVRREVALYWLTSLANVALATAVAWGVGQLGAGRAALAVTPIVAYAAITVVRYAQLDRLVFRAKPS